MTDHLFGDHHDGLDAELPAAHVKEVLETGPQEIYDEDVVEAFLAEVIDLRYAGWMESRPQRSARGARRVAVPEATYESQRESCTSCTRPAIEGHHSCAAPVNCGEQRRPSAPPRPRATSPPGFGARRTNLIATVWELSRLVPRE